MSDVSPLVQKVADALRAECLAIFGSTWGYDNAWRLARAAIAAQSSMAPTRSAEIVRLRAQLRAAHCFGFLAASGPANAAEVKEAERLEAESWRDFCEQFGVSGRSPEGVETEGLHSRARGSEGQRP